MKTAVLILVAVASTPSAAPPEQFDLLCKGQWRFSVADPYEPHDFRLRIDLKAERFCEADCKVTKAIAEVQPAVITLSKATNEEVIVGTTIIHTIDRTTGKFTYFKYAKRPEHRWIEQDAMCERAPFSGFPQPATKF